MPSTPRVPSFEGADFRRSFPGIEMGLGGHHLPSGGGLGHFIPQPLLSWAFLHQGKHQLIDQPRNEAAFSCADGPYHTDINIPLGTPGNIPV